MVLQPDGKTVVAGDTYSPTGVDGVALARYNADGSLDRSFSGDGKATFKFPNARSGASDVALRGDMIAGDYNGPARGGRDFLGMRLSPDGSPDSTFSSDGRSFVEFGLDDFAEGLALSPVGTIVVAGSSGDGRGGSDFAVARLTPGGAADPTFSGDGEQTVDFGATDCAPAVRLRADGSIMLAADRPVGAEADFALARRRADTPTLASLATESRRATWATEGTRLRGLRVEPRR